MSGGTFDYNQYKIEEIKDRIQLELDRMSKDVPKSEYYFDSEFDDETYPIYPKEIIDIFKDGIKYLHLAEIYTRRIDWFLAGDDGEDSLVERLKEELNNGV